MFKLSSDKEQQETAVVETFLDALSRYSIYTDILGYSKLPEADHDFVLNCKDGSDILLQVTEIVERDYAFPITKADYNSGIYNHFIHKGSDQIPWAVDTNRISTSIQRRIEGKILKHYSKSEHETLWLLIFSTSIYPEVDVCVRGNKRDSEAVSIAHDYLNSLDHIVFDQIWYTNLMTTPVRIWPYDSGKIC